MSQFKKYVKPMVFTSDEFIEKYERFEKCETEDEFKDCDINVEFKPDSKKKGLIFMDLTVSGKKLVIEQNNIILSSKPILPKEHDMNKGYPTYMNICISDITSEELQQSGYDIKNKDDPLKFKQALSFIETYVVNNNKYVRALDILTNICQKFLFGKIFRMYSNDKNLQIGNKINKETHIFRQSTVSNELDGKQIPLDNPVYRVRLGVDKSGKIGYTMFRDKPNEKFVNTVYDMSKVIHKKKNTIATIDKKKIYEKKVKGEIKKIEKIDSKPLTCENVSSFITAKSLANITTTFDGNISTMFGISIRAHIKTICVRRNKFKPKDNQYNIKAADINPFLSDDSDIDISDDDLKTQTRVEHSSIALDSEPETDSESDKKPKKSKKNRKTKQKSRETRETKKRESRKHKHEKSPKGRKSKKSVDLSESDDIDDFEENTKESESEKEKEIPVANSDSDTDIDGSD